MPKIGKLRIPNFLIKFTSTEAFEKLVRDTFEDVDADKDGALTIAELYVAVLKLYDKLNHVLPCHLKIPGSVEMTEALKKFDKDGSGKLSYPEYLDFCKSLVGAKGRFWDSLFFKAAAVLAVKLLVIPLAAKGIKEGLKAAGVSRKVVDPVPVGVLAFGLEAAAKSTLPLPM